jgi:hypothetical protein
MAKLQDDIPKISPQLPALGEPPERPVPDYSESNKLFVDSISPQPGQPPDTVEAFAAELNGTPSNPPRRQRGLAGKR